MDVRVHTETGLDMSSLFKDLHIDKCIDAGHWLGREQPGWVNENIGEFLHGLSYR